MSAADRQSAAQPGAGGDALWRDPLWLGGIALFVVMSALLIAAIAARAAVALDGGALAASGLVVASGLVAAVAAACVAAVVMRRKPAAADGATAAAIVQALPHAGAVLDGSGRTVVANDRFRALLPDSAHAPLTALKRRLGDDAAAAGLIARLTAAAAAGAGAREEAPLRDAGDGIAWLAIAAQPVPGQSGAALWICEDVTARHDAEARLDAGLAELTEFVDSAPAGFYAADQDGRIFMVNAALAEWLGYAPGAIEAARLHLHELLLEPPAAAPAYRIAAAADAAADAEHRLLLRRADGGPLRVAVVQRETRGAGDSVRTAGVVRRVADETAAPVPAPLRSERRFARMFENAPVGVVLLDAAGRVTESNGAWQRLVAPGESGLAGRPLAEFVADEEADKIAQWLERLSSGNGGAAVPPQDVVLRTRTEADLPRIATMYVAPMDDGPGGGSIVHFHETTDQKNLEEQFAQSQKMQAVGQLAGGVAHDFNNLLTAMIGFCDLLLLRHSPGDQSFGDIMQIKQNANRAARLVRQLLAFSRQQTLQPRVLSITDVLGDLTNLVRRLIGANIKLTITHGRDLGLVRVDQGQLEQVVINLAVNARDAMRDGGELAIRTFNQSVIVESRRGSEVVMPGDYVVIEIADNGTGIAPQHRERIFEPFFTTKEVGAGTGLGLSTVYGIVKQTGGQVFVDSTVGKGTRFTIMIPQYVAEAGEETRKAEAAEGPAAADTVGAGTVLLVEDEDAVRLFSARALRAKGYKVLEARTGEAALELLGAIDDVIDLMITDAVMPEMDGPTLIKEMRDNRPDLPVICISGYAEETFREKLGQSDDIHFLPKPFSLNQLAGKVKDVMSLPHPG